MIRPIQSTMHLMNGISIKSLELLSALLIIATLANPTHATTVMNVGVDSNILVVNDKVFFAQTDKSLTVLDLNNGTVLARLVEAKYSGTIVQINEGILVWNYGCVTLIDSATLIPRWSVTNPRGFYAVNIIDQHMVAAGRDGIVECRDLASGDVKWTYNFSGKLNIVAQKDHVLIHQRYRKNQNSVVLLELDTGREIYRKDPPTKTHYLRAYFDGEQAYIALGSIREDETIETNLPGVYATCEHFLTWDLNGQETSTIEASSTVRSKNRYDLEREVFTLAGKQFIGSGLVYPEGSKYPNTGPLLNQKKRVTTTLKLPDGSIKVRNYLADRNEKNGTVVDRVSSDGNWSGYFPYLGFNGAIYQTAVSDNSLLLGSNTGHLECVDVATGRSRWLYIFPTIERIMSYSSPHGMPPYYADQAKQFHRTNEKKRRNVSGMVRLPNNWNENTIIWAQVESLAGNGPMIIFDPKPWNPFDDLSRLLLQAWLGAVAPIVLLTLIIWLDRIEKRKLPRWIVAGLWSAVLVISGMHLYNTSSVAFSSTMATKLALLCSTCFLLYHIIRLMKERQTLIASLYLGLLLISAYQFYLPMRYA